MSEMSLFRRIPMEPDLEHLCIRAKPRAGRSDPDDHRLKAARESLSDSLANLDPMLSFVEQVEKRF